MFDIDDAAATRLTREAVVAPLTVDDISSFLHRLAVEPAAAGDPERVELLTALESVKGAAAAAQARVTVAFDTSQRAAQAAQGVPAARQGAGVASQVALARRESPVKGGRHLGVAKALVHEMPQTLASLTAGGTTEWRATVVVRETAHLTVAHRAEVDRLLGPRLASLGDKAVERAARGLAGRLDPASEVRRRAKAHSERRVSIRPAPDTMSYLTGLLPVAQGVAVFASLSQQADTLRTAGDPRSRGQIMADTLVERVTGRSRADRGPVEVKLVMTDRTLLGGDHEPGRLEGWGQVPASLCRDLVRSAAAHARATGRAAVWLRRLFTSPATGDLVAMDSRRRVFDGGLADLLLTRDEVCRTPWCDAPIRHLDHVLPVREGGATSIDNGQGLCERCNYAKEAPGWCSAPGRDGARHPVRVTTPTGHTYTSRAPDPPGSSSPGPSAHSTMERHFADLLAAA